MALHGHLTAAAAAAAAGTLSSMGQRQGQIMDNYHSENVLREKDHCFSQEKRSKKARSMDQTIESKQ